VGNGVEGRHGRSNPRAKILAIYTVLVVRYVGHVPRFPSIQHPAATIRFSNCCVTGAVLQAATWLYGRYIYCLLPYQIGTDVTCQLLMVVSWSRKPLIQSLSCAIEYRRISCIVHIPHKTKEKLTRKRTTTRKLPKSANHRHAAILNFYARQHNDVSADMPSQFLLSVRLSICLSVYLSGGSVNKKAVLSQR